MIVLSIYLNPIQHSNILCLLRKVMLLKKKKADQPLNVNNLKIISDINTSSKVTTVDPTINRTKVTHINIFKINYIDI